MRATLCATPLACLLAACGGGTDNARLVDEVRGALSQGTTATTSTLPVSGNISSSTLDAWVSCDPFEIDLHPERNELIVSSRSAMTGAAGLLVRASNGRWRVRWRVRVDRMDWSSGMRLGLCPLEGHDRNQGHVQLGCGGGDTDLRFRIVCLNGQGSHLTSFRLGQDLDLELAHDSRTMVVSVHRPFERIATAEVSVDCKMPQGKCLLGLAPVEKKRGVVMASVILLELDGLEPIRRSGQGIPTYLRDGPLSDARENDPFARIIGLLRKADVEWSVVAKQARRLAATLGSLIESPRVDGWIDAVAQLRASPAERSGRMVPWLEKEVSRSMNMMAAMVNARQAYAEWRGASTDLNVAPVQAAVLEILRARSLLAEAPSSAVGKEALARAFAACRCDHTASLLLGYRLVDDDVLGYLLTEEASPFLAARCAALCLGEDPATAVRLCERALEGGCCDERLGETITDLGETDLHGRWLALRAKRAEYEAAAQQLERRMMLLAPR